MRSYWLVESVAMPVMLGANRTITPLLRSALQLQTDSRVPVARIPRHFHGFTSFPGKPENCASSRLKVGLHPGNPGLKVLAVLPLNVAPRRGEQGKARRHRRQILSAFQLRRFRWSILSKLRPTLTSILLVSSLLLTAAFAEGEVLQPKENLTVNPKLSADDKEATNVSGAACFIVAGERKSCLLIGDEVRYARFFSIDGKTLVPGQKIFLLPERDSNGHKFKETDAEGIAFAKISITP